MYTIEADFDVMPDNSMANYHTSLYLSGDYEQAATLFMGYLTDKDQNIFLTPDSCVAGLLSLCRLKRFDEAKAAVKALERKFPLPYLGSNWTLSSTLASIGFSTFLNMLGTMLLFPDQFDIEAIDLFNPNEY